jgi:hypothetical protein
LLRRIATLARLARRRRSSVAALLLLTIPPWWLLLLLLAIAPLLLPVPALWRLPITALRLLLLPISTGTAGGWLTVSAAAILSTLLGRGSVLSGRGSTKASSALLAKLNFLVFGVI